MPSEHRALGEKAILEVGPRTGGLRQRLGSVAPNSLRARLAFALVIAAALPLGGAGYLFSNHTAAEAVDAAEKEHETLANSLAAYMENFLDLHEGAATALAARIDVMRSAPTARREIEDDMRDLRAALPEFAVLSAHNPDGVPFVWSSDLPLPPIAGNLSPSQYVRRTNQPTILRVRSPVDGTLALTLGVPLKTPSGQNDGALIAVILADKVGALLDRASSLKGVAAYLVDAEGDVVAESGRANRLYTARDAVAPVLTAMGRNALGTSGSTRYQAKDGTQLASYARIGTRDWGVILIRPEATVLLGVESRRDTTTVILLFAILAAVAAALLGAKWLSDPLATLARAADRLGEGDASVPLPKSNLSEIAGLTLAFQNLRTRLQAHSAEVADTHAELEARVASRTEELRTSALQLQDELAQRIRMEAAIRTLSRERALILDTVAQGICEVDLEGHISFANPAAARMLGSTTTNLVGKPFHTLVHPDPEPDECALAAALKNSLVARLPEAQFTSADGTRLPVECICTPLVDEGAARGVLITFADATARLESQRQREALAEWEKLRALGQMASGVAHDLNQKLALIVGHSELAQRALTEDHAFASVADSLRIMGQAAVDGGETVKRLLLFGQPYAEGAMGPVDVGDLVHEIAALTAPRWRDAPQAEGRPITVSVDAEPHLIVRGWADNLIEALTNLIFNAVDAMPGGGTIRLHASRLDRAIAITVSDSGEGMSPEVQSRAFEPFFSTKGQRGTGLGLATVFSVAERHGGRVSLSSAPGQGTTVTLVLPASSRPAGPHADTPPRAPSASLHILAVDDQVPILVMVAAMLQPLGHTVDTATSGEEALEHLRTHTHDLVISDIGMGDGMNGWDLAEQVQKEFPGIPILLATGWGAAIDPEEARAKGVAGVVAKPFRKQDLVDAVNRARTARVLAEGMV